VVEELNHRQIGLKILAGPGPPRQHVSNMERGIRPMSMKTARDIGELRGQAHTHAE